MAKRQSSSRYVLAGSRDTANESRYDGSWRYDDKVYTLSSQCLTLGWLCCIASYDGLKIKKIGNISSLLFWYL
ncbi:MULTISPECIES: hypothetical protein [unclassified Wolbachia]|uniref:hypothetical protein n=1 Tax=unclassified Wolbachia TaxID=2640676 RepID=UPI0022309B43|nr:MULTISPECIES: hypothetical protein [unclassified Wolbachia]